MRGVRASALIPVVALIAAPTAFAKSAVYEGVAPGARGQKLLRLAIKEDRSGQRTVRVLELVDNCATASSLDLVPFEGKVKKQRFHATGGTGIITFTAQLNVQGRLLGSGRATASAASSYRVNSPPPGVQATPCTDFSTFTLTKVHKGR